MIRILVNTDCFPDSDIGFDSQWDLSCEIKISEDATVEEAMYGWFKALEVNGYSPSLVRLLRDKFEK